MDIILKEAKKLFEKINNLNIDDKIEVINKIKLLLHDLSPLKNEPIDCVQWIKIDKIIPNNYNPNNVAPSRNEIIKIKY